MRRIPIILFAALAAASAFASRPFEVIGVWAAEQFDTQSIASPKALQYDDIGTLEATLSYVDKDGRKMTKAFDVDPEDIEGSVERALEDIRSTVNTATDNAAHALAQTAILFTIVRDNAEKIEDILQNLVNVFLELSKLKIEDPETGETKELPVKVVNNNEVRIVGNVAQPVKVDNLSVGTNATGELQLYDFGGAVAGQFPYVAPFGLGTWLEYRYLGSFFDSALFAGQTNITLKGWNTRKDTSDNPAFCGDDLATQLTADNDDPERNMHYVLTAYGQNSNPVQSWQLHYTPIGSLTNLAATADLPWSWDAAARTFRNPWVQVGRATKVVTVGTGLADGSYYVAVDMAAQSVTFSQGATPSSDDSTAYFAVGTISNGKLASGIKSMPVCIFWE